VIKESIIYLRAQPATCLQPIHNPFFGSFLAAHTFFLFIFIFAAGNVPAAHPQTQA
jgi:hypothetical protein